MTWAGQCQYFVAASFAPMYSFMPLVLATIDHFFGWRLRRQCMTSSGLVWPMSIFFGAAMDASEKLHVTWAGQFQYFSAASSAPVAGVTQCQYFWATPSAPMYSFMWFGLANAPIFRWRLRRQCIASCGVASQMSISFGGAFGAIV